MFSNSDVSTNVQYKQTMINLSKFLELILNCYERAKVIDYETY